MAFATVVSITDTTPTAAGTSHAVNMPATVDAGDLLLVIIAFDEDPALGTTPTDWRLVVGPEEAPNNVCQIAVYVKEAVGDEDGTTVDFPTASESQEACAQCYRITGWRGDDIATDIEATAADTGGTGQPDPPALAPSWGAEDTLWITAYTQQATNDGSETPPSNYGNAAFIVSSTVNIGSARRELNTASEDPDAWAIGAGDRCAMLTIGVRPAAAGAGGIPKAVALYHHRHHNKAG